MINSISFSLPLPPEVEIFLQYGILPSPRERASGRPIAGDWIDHEFIVTNGAKNSASVNHILNWVLDLTASGLVVLEIRDPGYRDILRKLCGGDYDCLQTLTWKQDCGCGGYALFRGRGERPCLAVLGGSIRVLSEGEIYVPPSHVKDSRYVFCDSDSGSAIDPTNSDLPLILPAPDFLYRSIEHRCTRLLGVIQNGEVSTWL